MHKLADLCLKDFLEEVASSSPAPGGGSVAALAGAVSAALTCMVCNLTIGKDKYKEVEEEMKDILARSKRSMEQFKGLIDKDTEAFNEVINALKLPKENEEQKRERKRRIQHALKGAVLVPLETGRLCLDAIRLSKRVAEKGNKSSITDAGVSAIMAKAGFDSAMLNVRINLLSIHDEKFVKETKKEIERMDRELEKELKDVLEIVNRELEEQNDSP